MNKLFLCAKPDAVICPFCGKKIYSYDMHFTRLSTYTGGQSKLRIRCKECDECGECCGHKFWIYFSGTDMHYFIDGVKGKLLISEIVEDPANQQLTFSVELPAPEELCKCAELNPPERFLNPLCFKRVFKKGTIQSGFVLTPCEYDKVQLQIANSHKD